MSTLLKMNISETSGPIAIKFYLKHHWGGEKAAIGFRIRNNMVSLETVSSHRVKMGKLQHSSAFIFDRIFFIRAGNKDSNKSLDVFEFRLDSTTDCGISCP